LTTYTEIGEIDGGDNVYILGGPTIQVAYQTYSSTAGFQGMTDISSVYCSTVFTMSIVTVTVVPGGMTWFSAGVWAVISGMYVTHLKYGQCLFY